MAAAAQQTVKCRLPVAVGEPQGQDCFGDDRESMNDFAKYFNNTHLSDVTIICGEQSIPAHLLVLARGSDVFDRMLSDVWDSGNRKELVLVEDAACTRYFAAFLRFLYCNHVVLHAENTLCILILADKYNVPSLKKDYAVTVILPTLSLKEIYSEWFNYATRAFHPPIIRACISAIGAQFETVISDEWQREWEDADAEQIEEILRCNSLVVGNEFQVWAAVMRWLCSKPERRESAAKHLTSILPLIRFPFMSGEELCEVEYCELQDSARTLIQSFVNLAYKYQAQPLGRRITREFTGCQFLLRQYTEVRWNARLLIPRVDLEFRSQAELSCSFMTRASALGTEGWRWSLKIIGSTYSGDEMKKMFLVAEDIDQGRSVEYLFAICDENKVLRSISGKKTFTKTRPSTELCLKHKDVDLPFHEVIRESALFVKGDELQIQIMLKPIE